MTKCIWLRPEGLRRIRCVRDVVQDAEAGAEAAQAEEAEGGAAAPEGAEAQGAPDVQQVQHLRGSWWQPLESNTLALALVCSLPFTALELHTYQ